MAEFVGGATWGTATVSAFFSSETLTDLTLLNLTLFEDDFATPADLLGCPDGRAVADRSCRVDCAGIGTTVTVVGCQDLSAEGTTLNSTVLLLLLELQSIQPRERKPPPSLPV